MTTPDENTPSEPVPEASPVGVPEPIVTPVTPPPPPAAPPADVPATSVPVNEDSPLLAPQGMQTATPYGAPTAPPPAYATAPNPMPNTWMNIVAFVTGLLGIPIVPIIFGHMGVSQSNKGTADFKWMGIVGLVLGYLAIVGWLIFVAALIGFAASSTY